MNMLWDLSNAFVIALGYSLSSLSGAAWPGGTTRLFDKRLGACDCFLGSATSGAAHRSDNSENVSALPLGAGHGVRGSPPRNKSATDTAWLRLDKDASAAACAPGGHVKLRLDANAIRAFDGEWSGETMADGDSIAQLRNFREIGRAHV